MIHTLCIYGAGGFGIEIADLSLRINKTKKRWDEICFIDDTQSKHGRLINGLKVKSFAWAKENSSRVECKFAIAVGEPYSRKLIAEKVTSNNFDLETLIDPTAIVSDNSAIGQGVIIPQYATVAGDSYLGFNTCLNVGTIVGHEVKIGAHSVLSSQVNIGGESVIGESTYVGMGSLVKEKLLIGSNVIIGMGSVVHYKIDDGVIALGNPARVIRRNESQKVFK